MDKLLLERFNKNEGFLRTADSLTATEKYHLRRLIREGIVNRVKRGFYRLNDSPRVFQESEVAKMIPNGIFCMFTAWSYYELSTHVPAEYHIAIPRTNKIVLPIYPPVKLHYYGLETFETGKTSVKMNGSLVNVYNLERSVCDAVKFRNKVGTDILSEILHNYIRRKDKNLDKLMKYADRLRISNSLNQMLQIIL